VGLASHWPCVTTVVYPSTGSVATEMHCALRLRFPVGNGVLNRSDRVSECDGWTGRITVVPAVEFDPGVRIVYERNKHADVPPLHTAATAMHPRYISAGGDAM